MNPRISVGIQNVFTAVARERCMANFKTQTIPRYGKVPSAKASVLLPLCKVEEVPSLLYTVRSSSLRTAAGEVAFPGGKAEQNETPVQTALRETYEEIGLKNIDVWGQGPPVPGRNNKVMITPVIGCLNELNQDNLNINNKEVAEVFTVPLELLCEPKNQYYTQFSNGFILPVFLVEDYKIWGITAYFTHAFLSSILSKDIYKNDWRKKKITLEKAIETE